MIASIWIFLRIKQRKNGSFNRRVPTLVDSNTGVTISESGAILQHLVDTYDKEHKFSYEVGTNHYYHQLKVRIFKWLELGQCKDK